MQEKLENDYYLQFDYCIANINFYALKAGLIEF